MYTVQSPDWLHNNCTVTVRIQYMCTHNINSAQKRYIGTRVKAFPLVTVRWQLAMNYWHECQHCSLSPSGGRSGWRDKLWETELSYATLGNWSELNKMKWNHLSFITRAYIFTFWNLYFLKKKLVFLDILNLLKEWEPVGFMWTCLKNGNLY